MILSGIMLMGAAGFGAYSWFKSSATVTPNLVVEAGTLLVTAKSNTTANNGWELQNTDINLGDNKTEGQVGDKPTQNHPNFKNIRPGDLIIKKVTIINNGSLKERLNFDVNNVVENSYKNAVGITIKEVGKTSKDLSNLNGTVLEPGQSIQTEIQVNILKTMTGDSLNGKPVAGTADKPDFQGKPIHLDGILGNKNLIVVTGEQVNENPVTIPTQK